MKALQAEKCRQKRLLAHIVNVVTPTEQTMCQNRGVAPMSLHQGGEDLLVAVLKTPDKFLVTHAVRGAIGPFEPLLILLGHDH